MIDQPVYLIKQLWNNDQISLTLDRQQVLGGVITHALNSPLTVLQNTNKQTDKQCAINHIKSILSDFSNRQLEVFSYQQLVAHICQQIDLHADSDRIYYRFDKKPTAALYGKQALLVESVVCLMNNALAANDKTLVGLNSCFTQNLLKITVSDFGPGMSFLQQKMAMIPFISGNSNGNGIGLPFARWVVVRKFRGDFQLLSKTNMGTMVVLKIPVVTLS